MSAVRNRLARGRLGVVTPRPRRATRSGPRRALDATERGARGVRQDDSRPAIGSARVPVHPRAPQGGRVAALRHESGVANLVAVVRQVPEDDARPRSALDLDDGVSGRLTWRGVHRDARCQHRRTVQEVQQARGLQAGQPLGDVWPQLVPVVARARAVGTHEYVPGVRKARSQAARLIDRRADHVVEVRVRDRDVRHRARVLPEALQRLARGRVEAREGVARGVPASPARARVVEPRVDQDREPRAAHVHDVESDRQPTRL